MTLADGRPTVDFDIYDPSLAFPEDVIHGRLDALRALGPVVWSTAHGGHWVVTGYEEGHAVLKDADAFSSWPNNLVLRDAGQPMIPLEVDPPLHTAYRTALLPLFSPGRMKALEAEIRDIVNGLIDGFAADGRVDFVPAFAHELPARVFLALMGWPYDDVELFSTATDTILLGVPGGTEGESNAARFDAVTELYGYFGRVIAQRRSAAPEGDVTASVMTTPIVVDGEPRLLTDDELCAMFFLLLIAGLHTVQGSLSWAMIHLAGNPAQREALLTDGALLRDAVEEVLRIEAAVSLGRRATRDVELGGQRIAKGDQLLVVVAALNRDPRAFDEPGELRLDRSSNTHLAFGSGPHRCLGSHLARLELTLALDELHRRIPDYRIDPDLPVVSHSSQVRGVASLPLLFAPERR